MLAAAAALWDPTDRQLSHLNKLFHKPGMKVPRGGKAQRIATELDRLETFHLGTVTSKQVTNWWVDKRSRLLAGQRAAGAAGAAGVAAATVAAVVTGAAGAAGTAVADTEADPADPAAAAALAVGPGRYCPPRHTTQRIADPYFWVTGYQAPREVASIACQTLGGGGRGGGRCYGGP